MLAQHQFKMVLNGKIKTKNEQHLKCTSNNLLSKQSVDNDSIIRTILINFLCQLERLGCCQVSVGCRDSKDYGVRVADVPETHFSDLKLNIVRLIANRNLRDARQVN